MGLHWQHFLAGIVALDSCARGVRDAALEYGRQRHAPFETLLPELAWHVLGLLPAPTSVLWLWEACSASVLRPGHEVSTRDIFRYGVGVDVAKLFPRGDRFVTAEQSGRILVWDAFSGRRLRVLWEEAWPIDIDITPDGRKVVAVSYGHVTIWSAESGEELMAAASSRPGSVASVRVLPGGERFAIGAPSQPPEHVAVELRQISDGRVLHVLRQEGAGMMLAVSPCGEKLAMEGREGIVVWGAGDGRREGLLERSSVFMIAQLLLSEGAERVVAVYGSSCVVWDGRTTRLLHFLDLGMGRARVALLPGLRLASVSHTDAGVWDLRAGRQLLRLDGVRPEEGDVMAMVASRDGRFLAACGSREESDSTHHLQWVKVWNLTSGRVVAQMSERHPLEVFLWPCVVDIASGASALDEIVAESQ